MQIVLKRNTNEHFNSMYMHWNTENRNNWHTGTRQLTPEREMEPENRATEEP